MASGSRLLSKLRGGLMGLAGALGLLALLLAWSFHGDSVGDARLADRIDALPDAFSAAPGEEVAIDGTVGAQTPVLRDGLVAFRRVQRRGTPRNGTSDVTLENGTQPLVIDTAGGTVVIANGDYRFEERDVAWAPVERVESEAGLAEGAITLRGFEVASPVAIVGTLESADPVTVRAETLAAGPLANHVARLRRGSGRLSAAVPWLAVAGLLLLAYAIWEGRRIYRRP